MKLLQFAWVGEASRRLRSKSRRERAAEPPLVGRAAEDPTPSCAVDKTEKKLCRSSSSAAAAAATAWRPALGAIAEDGVQPAKAGIADRRASPAKPTPPRSKSAAIVRSRPNGDNLRHFSIPAFAPTGFMF